MVRGPTKEEEAKPSSYDGDINELQSREVFQRILRIPFAFLRVEIYVYCTKNSVEFYLWSSVSCFLNSKSQTSSTNDITMCTTSQLK